MLIEEIYNTLCQTEIARCTVGTGLLLSTLIFMIGSELPDDKRSGISSTRPLRTEQQGAVSGITDAASCCVLLRH